MLKKKLGRLYPIHAFLLKKSLQEDSLIAFSCPTFNIMAELMQPDDPSKNMGAIERVLSILALFASERNSLSTQDIIALTGIPQSTCFRLLRQLVDAGFLQRYGKQYGLGEVMLRMAYKTPPFDALRQVAWPYMRRLSQRVHHSVGLNVLNRTHARLCIEMVHDPAQEIRQRVPLFTPLPICKGASGKVLWAFLPEGVQYRVFQEYAQDLDSDWETVAAMLRDTRERGYCCSKSERLAGASAVSVPVFDTQRHVVASLSISIVVLPLIRDEDVSLYVKLLQEASAEISKNLNGHVSTEAFPDE